MSLHRRVEARDRGLQRISRLTSLTLSGGLVMSGGFAVVAAHAYAGHSRRSTRSSTGARVVQPTAASGNSLLAPATTTTVAPLGTPQTLPQSVPQTAPSTTATTAPQYVPQYVAPAPPDPIVSGGS
jgi:DNA-binding IclR family transcriptional regulator